MLAALRPPANNPPKLRPTVARDRGALGQRQREPTRRRHRRRQQQVEQTQGIDDYFAVAVFMRKVQTAKPHEMAAQIRGALQRILRKPFSRAYGFYKNRQLGNSGAYGPIHIVGTR